MVLKKEIVKTQNKDFEKGGEYRQMLVQVRGAEARAWASGTACAAQQTLKRKRQQLWAPVCATLPPVSLCLHCVSLQQATCASPCPS